MVILLREVFEISFEFRKCVGEACADSIAARYRVTEWVKLPSNISFGGKNGMPSEAALKSLFVFSINERLL